MDNLVQIGKRMSYLLRHNPEDLSIDKNGWVKVEEMVVKLNITNFVLDLIVDTNNKKRYAYNEDKTLIRASQGHSIKVDVELKEMIPSSELYHGTSPTVIELIMKSGLKKMNRQHVHLSPDIDTAKHVGKRHTKYKNPIILSVDCKSMVTDGYKFYISVNGVWLTDNIPPKYLTVCH